MHKDDLAVIWSLQKCRRSVVRYPAFFLSNIDQCRKHSLLCRRSRIQIIGKNFVKLFAPIMHHDLLPAKMSMAERRCHVNDRPRCISFLHIFDADEFLDIGECKCKERSICRRNYKALVSVELASHYERHHNQFLMAYPVHGLLPELRKFITPSIFKFRFICRQFISDIHTVRIAPSHISICKVYRRTVFTSHDIRFHITFLFRNVIADIESRRSVRTIAQFYQLRLSFRKNYFFCRVKSLL